MQAVPHQIWGHLGLLILEWWGCISTRSANEKKEGRPQQLN